MKGSCNIENSRSLPRELNLLTFLIRIFVFKLIPNARIRKLPATLGVAPVEPEGRGEVPPESAFPGVKSAKEIPNQFAFLAK